MSELFIGLLSGTSIDAVDAAIVDFSHTTPKLIATHNEKIPPALRQDLAKLCQPGDNEIDCMGEIDIRVGKLFAQAANNLLQQANIKTTQIKAIGSHGQTIRHRPDATNRFTLQIGDPNTIAAATGITTVADFRRRDIAVGGQGAPLAPALHQHIFHDHKHNRIVVNIGGIANITVLPKDANKKVHGFDTGPGNCLIDAWTRKHLHQNVDKNGAWAKGGTCNKQLLAKLLDDPYFAIKPPKSTGREYFTLAWLDNYITSNKTQDIQATLVELTAVSIMDAINKYGYSEAEIFVCGGGTHNNYLMQRLQQLGNETQSVQSTAAVGVDPDWVEAMLFAWLAKMTLYKQPGNLPAVTGAKKPVILGGIYFTAEF